jgi:hypothetical protein
MTTQIWNKAELSEEFPQAQTLQSIITSIEGVYNRKGEVICEIRVNGLLMDENDEKKFAESSSSEIQQIEVRTNRPADLIRNAMNSVLTFIPDLERASLAAAEKLRGAEFAQGQKSFGEVLEGCQWIFDTLLHVRGAASGTGKPLAQPERWYEAEKIIAQVVKEVSGAYGNNDFVLVADLLEYEVTGAMAIWKEVIESEQR